LQSLHTKHSNDNKSVAITFLQAGADIDRGACFGMTVRQKQAFALVTIIVLLLILCRLHRVQFIMGLSFSRIFERMFGKKEMRILMVGLDAAGKVCVRRLAISVFF